MRQPSRDCFGGPEEQYSEEGVEERISVSLSSMGMHWQEYPG